MQKIRPGWGILLAGALALVAGSAPAIAQTPPQRLVADNAAIASFLETTSYTYENLFSIAFPVGWQVVEQANVPQVVATSGGASASLPAMRTEVSWRDAPPAEVVGAELQTVQDAGYRIDRYDAATIDGVTAIRLWIGELSSDLPNVFVTYVGYPQATAIITTYYGDTEASIDPVLMAIHQSFVRSR